MFSEIQDDSGFIPVGFIKIELMPETERLNFIYRESSVEGEGWAFSWGLNENHIEVCEVSEGPDGEDCYSHRDSIDWGDESDYPDPDRLSRISFIASTWIKENAAEFLEGENGKGI
jgi:hypothetical protein